MAYEWKDNYDWLYEGWSILWKVSYYEKFIAAHPINLSFSDCATLHKTS